MSKVNHFAISAILNSEIVGRVNMGHGQIDSLGDAQRFLDVRSSVQSPADIHRDEVVDARNVADAFLAIRNAREDRGSADLYIADPDRNALFLAKCSHLRIKGSPYVLNKSLMNARKNGLLPGLKSVRTPINCEEYAFACEFAATELKYKLGVSIDDIVCDPDLATQFDSIASKLAPGHSSFEYRWAILSIRKSGRSVVWQNSYKMPKFTEQFTLVSDPLDNLPSGGGAYLLYEKTNNRPLYARATEHVRRAVELHRKSEFMAAILDKFWEPRKEDFLISFATIPKKGMLKPVEHKIIEEQKPLFNVPRAA